MEPIENRPPEDEIAEDRLILIPVTADDVARRKRRVALTVTCVTLAVLLLAGYIYKLTTDPLRARQSYDSGMRLFNFGRYSQAILAFDRVASLQPNFADAYMMRGRSFAADGKIDRAIADFTKTLELRPNDAPVLVQRGRLWLELKDYPSARADADRAIRADSKFDAAYNLRGMAIRDMGDPRKAIEDFTRAVSLAQTMDNYYQRGATYQILGDHRRALADFDQVIAIQPDDAPGYFARSASRRAIGDLRGAAQDHLQGRILDGR